MTAYFDVTFSKCHKVYKFSTSPFSPSTHWMQTTFYLSKDYHLTNGDIVNGSFKMMKSSENFRDFNFELSVTPAKDDNNDSDKNFYKLHF